MSKYSEIAERLEKEITEGRFSPAGKLPTEHELVSRFGVSRQTIRQAILSLKNRGVVYQIQGSGTYVSDRAGSVSRTHGSAFRNVLVICTYISEYIFPSIVRGIEATLNGTGTRIHIAATGNNVGLERKILTDVIKLKELDGIIVEGSKTSFPNPNIPLYREIEKSGIPFVFLHCAYPELSEAVVVGMDDYAGGKTAVRRLLDGGCSKICGIFKSDDRQGLMRYAGFSEGALESGFNLDDLQVRWYTTEDIIDHGMGLDGEMISAIAKSGVDGIVCYNDQIASSLIRDFTRLGYPIPKLISFDHSYLCEASAVHFDSLGHRKEELGRLAATKIRNMIEGKKETSEYLGWLD